MFDNRENDPTRIVVIHPGFDSAPGLSVQIGALQSSICRHVAIPPTMMAMGASKQRQRRRWIHALPILALVGTDALLSTSTTTMKTSSKNLMTRLWLSSSNRGTGRRRRLAGKDEVDSIVADMGLTPAKKLSIKKKQSSLTNINLRVQLDYARNGHAVLRNFLDPQRLKTIRQDVICHVEKETLQAWRQKVEVASTSPDLAQSCKTVRDCQEQLNQLSVPCDELPFLQYFNTWQSLNSVQRLAFELGEAASTLMNVPSVRLYQDSIFWKRAGDGPTPWHTDARMAPFDTSHMVTFWISLNVESITSSGLIFCSKSHMDFALPFWNDFQSNEFQRLEERYGNSQVDYMPLFLGDVTTHSGWTLHCANGCNEDMDRLALAITYVDARAEIRQDAAMSITQDTASDGDGGYGDNEDYWSYKGWVEDVTPRSQFRHKLVPIVWPKQSNK